MSKFRPIIAVTMGDAAGTGPEIITKALSDPCIVSDVKVVVIGSAAVIKAAQEITGAFFKLRAVKTPSEAEFKAGTIDIIDLNNIDLEYLKRGRVDPMAGKAAYDYIKLATELALEGEVNAIVTSAISKEALNKAGYHYAGHTELLAELCRVKDTAIMLVSDKLRVVHVTTHVSLQKAIKLITAERILTCIKNTDDALKQLGITRQNIAVAGLNPHAGEGGLFGDEETRYIIPAVEAACQQGFSVTGPIPADSIFFRAAQGEFDIVVAMYHDQGHIAVKMLGIDNGVNVTLGLPIIRTSVDHGTAFDKAGKGIASPQSLIEALRLANIMCINRLSE